LPFTLNYKSFTNSKQWLFFIKNDFNTQSKPFFYLLQK
jgi:hypothetical protein